MEPALNTTASSKGKFGVSIIHCWHSAYTEDGFHLKFGFRFSSQMLVFTLNLGSRKSAYNKLLSTLILDSQ